MVIRYFKLFIRRIILNIYIKPKNIISLVKNFDVYCKHESYFPEKKSKSKKKIFFDQFMEVLKYGYPNKFYFPYGFDIKNREETNKYIPYIQFMTIRDSLNTKPHSATAILRNKVLFGLFTNSVGVRSGDNFGVIGKCQVLNLRTLENQKLDDFLQELTGRFIFKPVDGQCGEGLFTCDISDGICYRNKIKVSKDDFLEYFRSGTYLVQKVVDQHPILKRLHPQSLNTIRLVTIKDINTDEIVVFPSIIRIGTGNSFVDNTSQGGLAVAVDIDTGQLGNYGYYKPEFGTKTGIHPDSKIEFSSVKIPFFQEAKEKAILLHSLLSDIHSIGWDIAIDEDGPVFIEGNDNWEINGPQICNGPLKELFIKYCFKY